MSCSHAFVYIAILLIVFTVRFIARFKTSTTWVLRQPTISESHNLLCVQKTTRIRPPVAYKFYVRNDRGWSRGTGYGTARMTADTLDKSPVRTGLRFDSSWDSTVWMTWGTSDDGIFYLFITDYIFKIENIYLCVEQKRFGGHGVHWSSFLMFPLGVGIPRFAHKPCRRQLSACSLSWRHRRCLGDKCQGQRSKVRMRDASTTATVVSVVVRNGWPFGNGRPLRNGCLLQ